MVWVDRKDSETCFSRGRPIPLSEQIPSPGVNPLGGTNSFRFGWPGFWRRTTHTESVLDAENWLEHGTWVLPKVHYETQGNTIRAIEPMVDGQPVTEFVAHISDRLNCFVEDVMMHALQTQMPEGISISEIPVAERPKEIVERFRPVLVGGGVAIWKILYHDSKFEDH